VSDSRAVKVIVLLEAQFSRLSRNWDYCILSMLLEGLYYLTARWNQFEQDDGWHLPGPTRHNLRDTQVYIVRSRSWNWWMQKELQQHSFSKLQQSSRYSHRIFKDVSLYFQICIACGAGDISKRERVILVAIKTGRIRQSDHTCPCAHHVTQSWLGRSQVSSGEF
jgi:hypothetical protein